LRSSSIVSFFGAVFSRPGKVSKDGKSDVATEG